MHNKLLKIISSLILGLVILIIGVYVGGNYSSGINSRSQNIQDNTVSVMLDYSGDIIRVFDDIAIDNDETLFEILGTLTEKNNIEFDYKDYGGSMGVFLTSINNVSSEKEADHWWQYWVNNQYSSVGVSSYIVQPGDVILFKFMSSQL